MKTTILAMVIAALALVGCSDDTIKPNAVVNPETGLVAGALPQAANNQAQAAPPAQSTGGWFLPAAVGYLLGRATAPTPAAPQMVPAAPVYTPRSAPVSRPSTSSSWFSQKKPAAASVVKPPVVSTTPKTFTPPKPTAAPKPSYSGPSSYKAPTYSFKPSSTPSRSFSSGRR